MPSPNALYLDLIKRVLANTVYGDPPHPNTWRDSVDYDAATRARGADWPTVAHTMIGLERLDNLQHCLETALADGVPGDVAETGVWRGGACVLMRAVLHAAGDVDRSVWVIDSFEGMPKCSAEDHEADQAMALHDYNDLLAVPLETVQDNFARYGLLDDQVRFLPGWFRDTLPTAPIDRLAVLRLDGDLYESTTDALRHLYPKLAPGGFLIVDDYFLPSCRDAVHDYRSEHGITEPIQDIDGFGAYWRRDR
ncbi:TylF/MycF family methyltransferase [Actinokineospora globicatena]|uniref:Methyltransferase MtfB n=1 Tax=Actinokineospora globicatena TaxID=103729 RepID=A0A9W6QJM2_9PSEU|nr:TylF/MycF family methyltransferase [Actinokineospora globicatena]GLW89890.1 methyltransferase MtfB [Actinokineospora globicatena]